MHVRGVAFPTMVVAVAWCLAFIVWQLLNDGDLASSNAIGDLAPILPIGLTAGLALRASWRAPDRRSTGAWLIMALAFSSYLAGTVVWAWLELVRHIAPWPSLADVGFLAFYPLLLLGLLRLPGRRRDVGENLRLTLDIVIVVLAGAMAVWYFVIGPTAQGADGLSLATILSLAYPVGDLVLVFGIAMLVLRGTDRSGGLVLPLLLAGCCAFVVGDIGFAHRSLSGSYQSGDWPDGFWMVAWTVMVVGLAIEGRMQRRPEPVETNRYAGPSHVALLPYIAIATAFALALAVSWTTVGSRLDGVLLLAAAITATVVARQVTAQRDNVRLMATFHALATTDALTHLANRRHFLAVTEEHLQAGRGVDLFLVMADLDHFKSINDTYGHGIGDEALSWMAEVFRDVLPPDAVVGRLGGDEFVALLPGHTLSGSMVLAERLVTTIAAAVEPVAGGPQRISVSLGVAGASDFPDVVALLRAADGALYQAKRAGRGRACAAPTVVATAIRQTPVAAVS